MKKYTSLHNHTDYSNLRFIDSINPVDKLIDRARELGLRGVAITDHDSVSAHVKAIEHYNKNYADVQDEFKLILGNEVYLGRSDLNSETHEKGEKFFHTLLLAKDLQGHEQLRELSSLAWGRSYVKNNIVRVYNIKEDFVNIVKANPGHLIASTACLSGYFASMFAHGEYEAMNPFLDFMVDTFGKDNFYIEIAPSNHISQITFNKYAIENYFDDYRFIFTTDSHYLKKSDSKFHKWFLQSASADREVDEYYSSSYMMDYEEVLTYFDYVPREKMDQMADNTNHIADSVESYSLANKQIVPKIVYEYDRINNNKVNIIKKLFQDNQLENYKYLNYYLTTDNEADHFYSLLFLQGYHDLIYGDSGKVSLSERMKRLDNELEQIREISIKLEQPLSNYFVTMEKMIDIVWNEGDSIVGVSRGSAAGFLLNYLVGITQIDPQRQVVELPYWRFLHKDRPELPDIDYDTEATKRVKIFNRLYEYFHSIGSDIVNVCTFGTMATKKTISTAAKSLGIDDSVVAYLNSMVPNDRGNDRTLRQCYYGDSEFSAIKTFINEMNKHDDLWDLCLKLEGLISQLGVHASGVIVVNGNITEHNSIMKTSRGVLVSAYDLGDSEYMGGLKYDSLTVQALDKIRATLNYMLEDRKIEWRGSLRETYNALLLPKNLNFTEPKMWDKLARGDIVDVFQFDTAVGGQAIRLIQPENIGELAIANSLMRLMAQNERELPLDTYVKHKNDLSVWYREMERFGLTPEEIQTLEPYLKPLYGVADSQESVMMMTMDPKISNFSVPEANLLRRAIARKQHKVLEEAKENFYEKGLASGARHELLNYVWEVQIRRQEGYSFSSLHTMGYSMIALQQMNLAYYYPDIYWKCACLSVNAGAINEEDYYNLVDEGIVELTDEDDKRSQSKTNYGKVAAAISGFKKQGITILSPNINKSRMGFTPDVENNAILYGIKGISRVGEKVIEEIIMNRHYESLEDFIAKMMHENKKLISKDKVVNLIKSGAFDTLEKMPREEILRKYIGMIADQKNNLTLSNFLMLIRKNLVPSYLDEEKKCYNFTKYIRKHRSNKDKYLIDDISRVYILDRFPEDRIKVDKDGVEYITTAWWDAIYNSMMDKVRQWLSSNKQELLEKLNEELFNEEFKKYAKGTVLDWELQALSFFQSGHPLEGMAEKMPIPISKINEIKEGEIVGYWKIKGKEIPELQLHTIIGVVIDKEKIKNMVTLSTPEGVINVKMYKQQYSLLIHETAGQLDEDDEDYIPDQENFLEKGTALAITGVLRGDTFSPKTYKKTNLDPVMRIIFEDGNPIGLERKA